MTDNREKCYKKKVKWIANARHSSSYSHVGWNVQAESVISRVDALKKLMEKFTPDWYGEYVVGVREQVEYVEVNPCCRTE